MLANLEDQKTVKRLKRRWPIVAAILFVGVAAYLVRRPVACFVLFQLGRSRACTWADIRHTLGQNASQSQSQVAKLCRQLRTDSEGYELWETPKGDFWIPAKNGEKLPELIANLDRRTDWSNHCQVRSGDVVLDCGAHVGLFAKGAIASGANVVVAVEPEPENVVCLKRNFAEEIRSGRVIVYPKGVWNKKETLLFEIPPSFSAAGRVVLNGQHEAQVQQIPVTTIDCLVAELGLQRVDFIKLHVEGAEQQAIKGARETIAKFHPRLAIASNHRDDDAEQIPELVRTAWPGYQMSAGDCIVHRKRMLVLPEMLFFFD
jgi:FkbM family methyltransferase